MRISSVLATLFTNGASNILENLGLQNILKVAKNELENQMNSLFHYKYTKRCFIIPQFYKIGKKFKMTTTKTF